MTQKFTHCRAEINSGFFILNQNAFWCVIVGTCVLLYFPVNSFYMFQDILIFYTFLSKKMQQERHQYLCLWCSNKKLQRRNINKINAALNSVTQRYTGMYEQITTAAKKIQKTMLPILNFFLYFFCFWCSYNNNIIF